MKSQANITMWHNWGKVTFHIPQGGKMDAGVACGNAMETSNGGKL